MRKTKMPWFLCLLMLSTLGCAGTNGQRDLGGTTGRMATGQSYARLGRVGYSGNELSAGGYARR